MPIHNLSINAIKELTKSTSEGFEKHLQLRMEARNLWTDYLRESMLNDFEHHLKNATQGTGTSIIYPSNTTTPVLALSVVQGFVAAGLRPIAKITFTWNENDYSVISVQHTLDVPPVRYDLERFVASPLERRVLEHLGAAHRYMLEKLQPEPADK